LLVDDKALSEANSSTFSAVESH